MKGKSFILIVALVIFCTAANGFDIRSIPEMKELSSSEYGKSLLQTISLNLENGGSIQQILDLLNDLLSKLNQDQKNSDDAWVIEKKRLVDLIEEIQAKILELNKQLDAAKGEKARLEGLIKQAVDNLEQYNKQRSADQEEIANITEKRAKDKAEFSKSQDEHKLVIEAIDQVVEELSKLVGSISGEDKPEHVKEIEQEKRDRLAHAFLQITKDKEQANLFLQIATQADQDALKHLLELLAQLKEHLIRSGNADSQSEADSKERFEQLSKNLTDDIASLEQAIDRQEKNKKDYEEKLAAVNKTITDLEDLLKEKKNLLDLTQTELKTKEKQYNDDKTHRDQERVVILRLIKIVEDRLSKMSDFLKTKVGGY